jgi:hypothetical protein
MRRMGIHNTYMMPWLIEDDPMLREMQESWGISTFQPKLNKKFVRPFQILMRAQKFSRRVARHRCNMAGRMAANSSISTQRMVTYTKYTLAGEEVHGRVIDAVIAVALKRGEAECVVEVTHGDHTIMPKNVLTERYAASIVSVCFPTGDWVGPCAMQELVKAKVPVQHADTIVFREIREVVGLGIHKLFLQQIFKQPKMLFDLRDPLA